MAGHPLKSSSPFSALDAVIGSANDDYESRMAMVVTHSPNFNIGGKAWCIGAP